MTFKTLYRALDVSFQMTSSDKGKITLNWRRANIAFSQNTKTETRLLTVIFMGGKRMDIPLFKTDLDDYTFSPDLRTMTIKHAKTRNILHIDKISTLFALDAQAFLKKARDLYNKKTKSQNSSQLKQQSPRTPLKNQDLSSSFFRTFESPLASKDLRQKRSFSERKPKQNNIKKQRYSSTPSSKQQSVSSRYSAESRRTQNFRESYREKQNEKLKTRKSFGDGKENTLPENIRTKSVSGQSFYGSKKQQPTFAPRLKSVLITPTKPIQKSHLSLFSPAKSPQPSVRRTLNLTPQLNKFQHKQTVDTTSLFDDSKKNNNNNYSYKEKNNNNNGSNSYDMYDSNSKKKNNNNYSYKEKNNNNNDSNSYDMYDSNSMKNNNNYSVTSSYNHKNNNNYENYGSDNERNNNNYSDSYIYNEKNNNNDDTNNNNSYNFSNNNDDDFMPLSDTANTIGFNSSYSNGFENLGNTCYMNSILQSLFGLLPFQYNLRSLEAKAEKFLPDDSVIKCLIKLIKSKSDGSQNKNSLLRTFYRSITKNKKDFYVGRQEDAHEFLTLCLNVIKEEIKSANLKLPDEDKLGCPVNHYFMFTSQKQFTCSKCLTSTIKDNEHYDLPVGLTESENSTRGAMELQELLEMSFATENIEYKCEKCEDKNAEIKSCITKLPKIMMLCLKRYSYDKLGSKKLKQNVKFNTSLTFDQVCHKSLRPATFDLDSVKGQTQFEFFEDPSSHDDTAFSSDTDLDMIEYLKNTENVEGNNNNNSSLKVKVPIVKTSALSNTKKNKIGYGLLDEEAQMTMALEISMQEQNSPFGDSFLPKQSQMDNNNNNGNLGLFADKPNIVCNNNVIVINNNNNDVIVGNTNNKNDDVSVGNNNKNDVIVINNKNKNDVIVGNNNNNDVIVINNNNTNDDVIVGNNNNNNDVIVINKNNNDVIVGNNNNNNDVIVINDDAVETDKKKNSCNFTGGVRKVFRDNPPTSNTHPHSVRVNLQPLVNIQPGSGPATPRETPLAPESDDLCYHLVSVVSHEGVTSKMGHYVSDVLTNHEAKNWRYCDDIFERNITEEEVLLGRQSTAYLLFYVHKDYLIFYNE